MKNFPIFILILFLFGCNGGSDTTRSIKNSSNKQIKMLIFNNGFARGDTLNIAPGETKDFSISSSSDNSGEDPDCSDRIDSAQAFIEGGGELTKLIELRRNWEVSTEKVKVVPVKFESTCIFTINNSDIEE